MSEFRTKRQILRAALEARERFQVERIRTSNSIGAILRGADASSLKSERQRLEKLLEYAQKLEDIYDNFTRSLAKDDPLVKRMTYVRGVSFTSAAKLLAYIDIQKAETVSKLWRFCGYGVVDGKAEKPVKGEKRHYSSRMKKYLFQIATQFLRNRSRYALVYYVMRYRYERERPDWTPLRRHLAAIRKMVKVYLTHLWEEWREAEGLPVRALYVHERMGHTFIYDKDWFWSSEELKDEDIPMEVRQWATSRKEIQEIDTGNGNGEQEQQATLTGRYVRHAPSKTSWL